MHDNSKSGGALRHSVADLWRKTVGSNTLAVKLVKYCIFALALIVHTELCQKDDSLNLTEQRENGESVMKYITSLMLVGVATLAAACNKTEAQRSEEQAMERAHERQDEALERKQDRQEANLKESQRAEGKALQEAQEAEDKQVEQRHEALQPAAIAAKEQAPGAGGITAQAVAELSAARCAREARCGNVGADKDYSSQAQCETKMTANMKDELNAYECPNGIVMKEFSECLQAIRNETCGSPLDTIGRVMACRESDICAD